MLTTFLKYCCVSLTMILVTHSAYADIYKWVDEQGQTHYSQTRPETADVELIKTAPPPIIDPETAQQEVDELIKQQAEATKAKQEKLELQQQAAKDAEQKAKNCSNAKHNLQQYSDNPGRRVLDAEGNVTRPSEEDRQEMIQKLQEAVKEFCS